MAISCLPGEGVPDAGIAFPEPWCHGNPEKEVKELYPRGTEAATFHLNPVGRERPDGALLVYRER